MKHKHLYKMHWIYHCYEKFACWYYFTWHKTKQDELIWIENNVKDDILPPFVIKEIAFGHS